MTSFQLARDDYWAKPPLRKFGIGMVGTGSIVCGAHLPAYRAWDYHIPICCD